MNKVKKFNFMKHFGGVQSFRTGMNEAWCENGSHFVNDNDCTIIDNIIWCVNCVKKRGG